MELSAIENMMRTGQWQEAYVACQAMVQLQPTSAKMWGYCGLCSFRLNRFDDAVSELKRAITLDPGMVDAAVKLAQAYDRLGKKEEAYATAKEWLSKSPNDRNLQGIVALLHHQVRGNRTDGWERTQAAGRRVLFAGDERGEE